MTSIYFVKCGEHVKVGVSAHVSKRVKTLQGSTAQPVELLAAARGTLQNERDLHALLAPYRVRGEWFRDCDVVRSVMHSFVERMDVVDPTRATKAKNENFGNAWKALHAIKAAEALAAATGMSVRAAAYELSGEREVSAHSIAALINLCVQRNK